MDADYVNFESLSDRMQIILVGADFFYNIIVQFMYNFIYLFIKNLFIRLFSMLVTFTDACGRAINIFSTRLAPEKFQGQSSRSEVPMPL